MVIHTQATSPPPQKIDLDKLLGFLGFGHPRAATVFIGMEEGLSPDPPLREQLTARSKFPKLIGLKESSDAHADRFLLAERPAVQSTWNIMILSCLQSRGGTRLLLTKSARISAIDSERSRATPRCSS